MRIVAGPLAGVLRMQAPSLHKITTADDLAFAEIVAAAL